VRGLCLRTFPAKRRRKIRAKAGFGTAQEEEDPRLRLRGSIPVRRLHLLGQSPRDLALRPSHAPAGLHLVKHLLQPP
jgi:hypothetical protein